MRKTILGALTALLLIGGFVGGAQAAPGDNGNAGPNTNNEHGLCTAYFNGQKNGHDKHGSPPPFAALEAEADDGTANENLEPEQQPSDDVFEYCQAYGIGGQPEENGRFDCRNGEDEETSPIRDSDTDGEVECVRNPAP